MVVLLKEQKVSRDEQKIEFMNDVYYMRRSTNSNNNAKNKANDEPEK